MNDDEIEILLANQDESEDELENSDDESPSGGDDEYPDGNDMNYMDFKNMPVELDLHKFQLKT